VYAGNEMGFTIFNYIDNPRVAIHFVSPLLN